VTKRQRNELTIKKIRKELRIFKELFEYATQGLGEFTEEEIDRIIENKYLRKETIAYIKKNMMRVKLKTRCKE
jgi:isopentenyldiphosphate isomerase